MKLKHALILFAMGWCVVIIGSLVKIMHYYDASGFFITGTILQIIAIVVFVVKLIKHPKVKDFLNK
jgi:hypothetical protein